MQHESAVSFRRAPLLGPCIRLAKPGTPFRITPAGHKFRATVFADQHAPSRRTSTPFTEEDRKLVRHARVLFRQRGWRPYSPVTISPRSLLRPLAWNFPLIAGARKLILVVSEWRSYNANSSSNAFASFTSVNQPYTGASSSSARCRLPWSRQRCAARGGADFPGFGLL
jgi:hypothetical protein